MKCRTTHKKLLSVVFMGLAAAVLLTFPGRDPVFAADSTAKIRIGGTGGAMGAVNELSRAFSKKHPDLDIILIQNLGTRGGITALMAGALDIGLAGRPLNPSEHSSGLKDVAYARSPFVFVMAHKITGMNLTLDQIVKIYNGEMKKWPNGTPVRLILRPVGDVDTVALKGISPDLSRAVEKARSREGMTTVRTDGENADAIEKVRGAFGTSTLTQIISEKRSLMALPLNGVSPGVNTIEDCTYPYFKTFYMITGPKSHPAAQSFIEFVKSREGRAILTKTGNSIPRGK